MLVSPPHSDDRVEHARQHRCRNKCSDGLRISGVTPEKRSINTPPAVVASRPTRTAAKNPRPCSKALLAPRIANQRSVKDLKKASVRLRNCAAAESASFRPLFGVNPPKHQNTSSAEGRERKPWQPLSNPTGLVTSTEEPLRSHKHFCWEGVESGVHRVR
jgi:hypothetical protein